MVRKILNDKQWLLHLQPVLQQATPNIDLLNEAIKKGDMESETFAARDVLMAKCDFSVLHKQTMGIGEPESKEAKKARKELLTAFKAYSIAMFLAHNMLLYITRLANKKDGEAISDKEQKNLAGARSSYQKNVKDAQLHWYFFQQYMQTVNH